VRLGAFATLAVLSLAGCHSVRYDAGKAPSERRWERTVHFWLWGFKGDGRVDLDQACPEGVASFHSEATPLEWIAQVVTVGFWSPREVVVVCAEAAAPPVAPAAPAGAGGSP
jgi:hypothetical protein